MTTNEFIERAIQVHGDKYDYSKVNYTKSKEKVTIICPTHGEFQQTPNKHLLGRGCPSCAPNKKKTKEDFIAESKAIHGDKYDYSKVEYYNIISEVILICPEHGEFKVKPKNHLNGQCCPNCTPKSMVNRQQSFIEKGNEIHSNKYDYSQVEYKGYDETVKIICPIHGEFQQTPFKHLKGHGCPICEAETKQKDEQKNYKTREQKRIVSNVNLQPHRDGFSDKVTNIKSEEYKAAIMAYIDEISDGNAQPIPDGFINGFDLSNFRIYNDVAIGYNTLQEGCELNMGRNDHKIIREELEKKGIFSIHIFEDEWISKPEIVKSRIRNLLGKSTIKIFARKCEIREVQPSVTKQFLEENHIQGNVNSRYKYGLYYNNELVSIMTIGLRRKNLGAVASETVGQFELLRFANKINSNVIGGASKLLKHFIKEVHPKQIISYADKRWSKGKLYSTIGFTHTHDSQPSYFYIIDNKRENRFKYRKNELVAQGFDENMSEHDIMLSRNIYRIYDCGCMTFVMDFEK